LLRKIQGQIHCWCVGAIDTSHTIVCDTRAILNWQVGYQKHQR
jgi:hypothetical protein